MTGRGGRINSPLDSSETRCRIRTARKKKKSFRMSPSARRKSSPSLERPRQAFSGGSAPILCKGMAGRHAQGCQIAGLEGCRNARMAHSDLKPGSAPGIRYGRGAFGRHGRRSLEIQMQRAQDRGRTAPRQSPRRTAPACRRARPQGSRAFPRSPAEG